MTLRTTTPVGARLPVETSRERRSASEGFGLGMVFNLASLYVANYQAVGVLALLVALFAALRWPRKRLVWVALGSTLTGNPVNPSASIACNVLVAGAFLVVNARQLHRVPRWLLTVSALALLSVLSSVFFWTSGGAEALFSQAGAVVNYLLAPYLLIPILYMGLGEVDEPAYLATRLVVWLIAPTVLLLTIARAFGSPVVDPLAGQHAYELFAVYRLWNVDIMLTRTQVGMVLAAIACAAFALVVSGTRSRWRWVAGACLGTSTILMVLTGSVGSFLAMLAGMLAVIVAGVRRVKIVRHLTVGALVATATVGAWSLLPDIVREYAESRYEERFAESSGVGVSDRAGLWAAAARYAVENPTGVGWSLYIAPLRIFPHNDFLGYAIGYGLLCGALYAYLAGRVWWTFAVTWRSTRDEHRLGLLLAGLGVSSVLIVNSMSDHLTANRWYFNVVWSIIWYCYFASAPSGPSLWTRESR